MQATHCTIALLFILEYNYTNGLLTCTRAGIKNAIVYKSYGKRAVRDLSLQELPLVLLSSVVESCRSSLTLSSSSFNSLFINRDSSEVEIDSI